MVYNKIGEPQILKKIQINGQKMETNGIPMLSGFVGFAIIKGLQRNKHDIFRKL